MSDATVTDPDAEFIVSWYRGLTRPQRVQFHNIMSGHRFDYFGRTGHALGDAWLDTQYALRMSMKHGQPWPIVWNESPPAPAWMHAKYQFHLRIAEMLECGGSLSIAPTHNHWMGSWRDYHTPAGRWNNGDPYVPTRPPYRWDGGSGGYVCYQIESLCQAKATPADDIPKLIGWDSSRAFVRVGLPLSLETSSELMARCSLFIGLCSGFGHVSHSVGCPRVLIEYENAEPMERWHPRDGWTHAKGTDDAICKAQAMLR